MNKRYIDFVPAKGKNARSGGNRVAVKKIDGPETIAKKPSKLNGKSGIVKESKKKDNSAVINIGPKNKSGRVITRKEVATSEVDSLAVEELFAERKYPAGVTANSRLGVIEDYKPKFVQTEVKKRPLGAAKKVGPANTAPAMKRSTRPVGAKFVNTNKIEKRPLSRNVYAKKPMVALKETPEKPVRIIDKPDKDSKAGLVVAIILTIILGAAAGTVAFLLLPK